MRAAGPGGDRRAHSPPRGPVPPARPPHLFLPGSFHTRPDLGLPRGIAGPAASRRFLAALRRRGAGPGAGAELGASPPGPAAAAAPSRSILHAAPSRRRCVMASLRALLPR